jgi:hypothetical protein
VAAFVRDWKADRQREQQTSGRGFSSIHMGIRGSRGVFVLHGQTTFDWLRESIENPSFVHGGAIGERETRVKDAQHRRSRRGRSPRP